MNEIQVNMSDLRQQLGELVNRAAYGGERIILISHGQPRAVIISMQDYQVLKGKRWEVTYADRFSQALQKADQVREQIAEWQKEHGIEVEDSVETLRQLRQERDDELGNLH
jgi:prevent-host-death family protein